MVWEVALPHYLPLDRWSCGCGLCVQSQPEEGECERETCVRTCVNVCVCVHACVRACVCVCVCVCVTFLT